MKNILIITGIFPPDIGGPSTFVSSLKKYLEEQDYKPLVITLSDINQNILRENNLIKVNKAIPKLLRTIIIIYLIRKYANNVKSILSCGLIFETFIGLILLKKKKFYRFVGDSIWEKYIASKGEVNFNNYKLQLNIKIIFILRNLILRNFNYIITPSNFIKSYLINNLKINKNKIINIENFCDFKGNNLKIEAINKNNSNIRFITLSRLVKWKNIDKLIIAANSVRNIEVHILGTGPEEKNLKYLAKDSKNIIFHGLLERMNSLAILKECDCFIQISSYEGMSFSIIESLYLEKPMILSSIEPNFETAKTAALYINHNSIRELKAALELMKEKAFRNNLSNNAKLISSKFYDMNSSLDEYIKLLT